MLGQSESVEAFGTQTELKQGKLYHSHAPKCNLQEFHKGWIQCRGTGTVYCHLLGKLRDPYSNCCIRRKAFLYIRSTWYPRKGNEIRRGEVI